MKMNEKKINNYFNKYLDIILGLRREKLKINQIKKIILNTSKKQKILVFGNGGSSLIASHFALDVSNVLKKKMYKFIRPRINYLLRKRIWF